MYRREVSFYCQNMLCTDADGDIQLITPSVQKRYSVKRIPTVSTIGAGDNFNAGIVYGLLMQQVKRDEVDSLSEAKWDSIVRCGQDFAAEVCQSLNNSISCDFAKNYRFSGKG